MISAGYSAGRFEAAEMIADIADATEQELHKRRVGGAVY